MTESTRTRRFPLFWKWFLAFSALNLAIVAALVVTSTRQARVLLNRQLVDRLQSAAWTGAELFATQWPAEPSEAAQRLARELARRLDLRVTLIALDGTVLADSHEKGVGAVRALENHRGRPEFVAARRSGIGEARRMSPTLGQRYWYEAVRVDRDGEPLGVLRIAALTSSIAPDFAERNAEAWRLALTAGLAGVAGSFALARRLSSPWRMLATAAEAIASGRYDQRAAAAARRQDEVGIVARALNDIGNRLAMRERQLHATSQSQNTVLEAMTESVIAVDRGERILFANAAACRVLGIEPERVSGLTLLEAVRSHELREAAQRALRTQRLAAAELAWRGKSRRVFDVLATPLPGEPPPGVVLVLRDVSELKHVERMRQQFIANVSHELKTPLSSIKAYTETLLGGARNDAEHCERFLNRIDEQAGRLHQLIQDMLSLARIESGQAVLEMKPVPLARLVRSCLSDFESRAASGGVTLENLVGDDAPCVRADEEALRQILGNLIDNAVKYTPVGGRVSIRCNVEGVHAKLEVADTGIGIPVEHHERLFERFYRVDTARSRELGGTGLGLSIVKHLAHALGGTVAVESEVGCGSVFRLTLDIVNG